MFFHVYHMDISLFQTNLSLNKFTFRSRGTFFRCSFLRYQIPMQTVSVFFFSTLHCEGYTADLRYITGSLLLGVLAGSLKSYPPFWKARGMEDSQEKDYSFWGNDPNLYDALVYERKFKSEYLERKIYEWLLKSEPSIVKLIENKGQQERLM